MRQRRPRLSKDFAASARVYARDVASAAILFVGVSLAAGRVWRFPFDDELLTRFVAERSASAVDFVVYFLKGGDVHPPLAFLGFYGLAQRGFADWALRLVSLALTALAFALFHLLCLTFIGQRTGAAVRPATRLIAILLFGLCPMAVSQGDAIRWYPPFAAMFALFIVLYVAGGNRAAKLWSAVPLGLAASTNFLAIVVALPFMLYRYALERQFRLRFEAAYWLIVTVFAGAGLVTAYSLAAHRLAAVERGVFSFDIGRATAIEILGLFGGAAVGVGNAWLIIPVAAITPFAIVSAIDRSRPADPLHLLLLMLSAVPVMTLLGFAEPRSFLYLMPIGAALLTLFLSRQEIEHGAGRALILTSLLLVTAVGAIANVNRTTHPFKRNAVVPFREIVDFIRANGDGRMLVISTDPVIARELRHDPAGADLCASYFLGNAGCLAPERQYDTVFVIAGQSNRSRRQAYMRKFQAGIDAAVAGRRKVASMPAGLDEDAGLKARLMGVPLDKYILTVDVYR